MMPGRGGPGAVCRGRGKCAPLVPGLSFLGEHKRGLLHHECGGRKRCGGESEATNPVEGGRKGAVRDRTHVGWCRQCAPRGHGLPLRVVGGRPCGWPLSASRSATSRVVGWKGFLRRP